MKNKSPLHKTRFDELKKKKFVGEKAFTLYEGNIDRVQEELEKRGWMKLNGLIKDAISSMAVDFFSNAYKKKLGECMNVLYVKDDCNN